MMRVGVLLMVALSGVAWADDVFQTELDEWREARAERLTREDGWTALIGLHWLDGTESFSVGADAGSDIRIADAPASLGVLRSEDGGWWLDLTEGVEAENGETLVRGSVELVGDRAAAERGIAQPRLRHGAVRLALIERGDRQALRVWSAQAPGRVHFAGLSHFPADRDWQVQAHWQAHEPPRRVEIADVTGSVQAMSNPGVVVFERDGREHRLEALAEPADAQLFLIFADRSSGRETYGAGRYLYAERPDVQGRVLLDFNRAYNPPCAFSEFATCPLPPPENRLNLRVTAGELSYRRPDQG